jgi:hypothetical protein
MQIARDLEGTMTRLRPGAAGLAIAAAAGAMMTLAAPQPAAAQFFFGMPFYRPHFFEPHFHRRNVYQPPVMVEELTPREIIHSVHRYGFRDVTRPDYRDDVVLVTATNREGRRLRLEVDLYSGRILDAAPVTRHQLAQRAPEQGAAVRRAVPDSRLDARAAPDRPPTTVRREPMLPPQPQQQAKPPLARPQQAVPPKAQPSPQPPTAKAEPGTRAQPRRIDITPPAALDDVKRPPAPPAPPAGPPINSVPPAALE